VIGGFAPSADRRVVPERLIWLHRPEAADQLCRRFASRCSRMACSCQNSLPVTALFFIASAWAAERPVDATSTAMAVPRRARYDWTPEGPGGYPPHSSMRDEQSPRLFAYQTDIALRGDRDAVRSWVPWLIVLLSTVVSALTGLGLFVLFVNVSTST
jgi:hypothetical protein